MLAGMSAVKLFPLRSSSVSAGSAAKSSSSRPPLSPSFRSRSTTTLAPTASQVTPLQLHAAAAAAGRVHPDSAVALVRLAFHASSASASDAVAAIAGAETEMAAAAATRTSRGKTRRGRAMRAADSFTGQVVAPPTHHERLDGFPPF
uniref:Uncharacterized protein n=1 Tax=Oryza brachyantha TaxID=4533 RepID=J3N3B0_ORYBR